nr:NADH dehydrogenase subunit 5 [Meloidogyne javanica]
MILVFLMKMFNLYYEFYFCLMFFGLSMSFSSYFFNSILILIFLLVFMFSLFYMKNYLFFMYYMYMFFCFLMMMFMLNLIYGFHLLFFVWDMLGLVSYFLVKFYLNWEALSGALNTIFSNRIGDFFLIYFFCSEYKFMFSLMDMMSILFLFMSCLTKSSQFPFFGWLVKAMVAPTPVSSLVHSSTLVVSGCFLMYIYFENYNFSFMMFLFLISLLGMLISLMLILFEIDVKKMVAYSTMSQVSLIFLFFSYGWFFWSLLYLINHALFKSLLFLLVGTKIFYENGNQDSRYKKSEGNNFIFILFMLCYFSLIGMMFSGGMMIKDQILELKMLIGDFMLLDLLLFFCYTGTMIYSFKFLFIFMKSFNLFFLKYSYLNFFSMFILSFFSYYYLEIIVWNFSLMNVNFSEEVIFWLMLLLSFIYYFIFFFLINIYNEKFLGVWLFKMFSFFIFLSNLDFYLMWMIFSMELILEKMMLLSKKIILLMKYFFYMFFL